MSTPRNHHYVSQSLSRNFMPTKGIMYKYNKLDGRIYDVKSTKSLFSQRDLNSIVDEDGNADHESIEKALNLHFETHFPKHYQVLMDATESEQESGKFYPNSDEIEDAMEYILSMALIGHARHPQTIQANQNVIFEMLTDIADKAIPELREQITSQLSRVSGVTTTVPVDYLELKERIRKEMGGARFGVMKAPEDHYFLLPDCSSGIKRFPFSEDNSVDDYIGLALMPINSKMIIAATSRRLMDNKGGIEPSGFHIINSSTAIGYNRILYQDAFKEVACENKEYLEQFIKNINTFLTEELKRYYMTDFKENVLTSKNQNEKLCEHFIRINQNQYLQTLSSKYYEPATMRTMPLESYLKLAYLKVIEGTLFAFLNALSKHYTAGAAEYKDYTDDVKEECLFFVNAPEDNPNVIDDSNHESKLACMNDKNYFLLNHVTITIYSNSQERHDLFWKHLTDLLGPLEPMDGL